MDLIVNTHSNSSSILDLSQRPTTVNTNSSINIIDNWTNNDYLCNYTDIIDDNIRINQSDRNYNIEQSLTDQFQELFIKEDSISDSSKSKLDFSNSTK
jgi:hypothetical protein